MPSIHVPLFTPLILVGLSGCAIGLSGCTPTDSRLPSQLPAPATPALETSPAAASPAPEPSQRLLTETSQRLLAAPRWDDAARFDATAELSLSTARAALARVQARGTTTPAAGQPGETSTRPTLDEARQTLADFDQVFRALDTAGGLLGLMVEVSPVAAVREVAARRDQEIARLRAEVWLDRKVYEALSKIDGALLEPLMRRFLTHSLDDFRRAGVDQDEPTRARLAAIEGELKKLSQDYSAKINVDRRVVKIDAKKLAAMPADWLASHAADAAGLIAVSTDYPDYFPMLEYAKDDLARKAMWEAHAAQGMPENAVTLRQILTLRKEAATLLRKPNWAAHGVEDAMAKTPETVTRFIEELATTVRERSDKDLARALVAKQKDDPGATAIEVWDRFYYQGVVKKEDVAFDSELVRPYFPYTRVKEGLFALYGELFGVSFKRLPEAVGWHPSVETWAAVGADGTELGRFWLDMFPRDNKFKHAAMFPIQTGLSGERSQPAWGALVCNFPEPKAGDPALMSHDDVVTFFHELGHLIAQLVARGPAVALAADSEGDFIEAPSQLLEEWAWRPEILQRFAKHYLTGAPIPAELVVAMKKADGFGRGMDLMRQIFLSAYSWFIHVEDPAALDFDAFTTAMYARYSPYPRPEVDDLYANFGHLTDYSSNYYTYQWSLAIAKDLYTRFAPNPMDPAVAADYRNKVLAPGATKDADQLVADFLGRERNLSAYRAWLAAD